MTSLCRHLSPISIAQQYRKCKVGHDCRQVHSHRRRDSTRQLSRVGVGGVYWHKKQVWIGLEKTTFVNYCATCFDIKMLGYTRSIIVTNIYLDGGSKTKSSTNIRQKPTFRQKFVSIMPSKPTLVNSAFHPSGVGKSSTSLLAVVKAVRVHLCRVADNTV